MKLEENQENVRNRNKQAGQLLFAFEYSVDIIVLNGEPVVSVGTPVS